MGSLGVRTTFVAATALLVTAVVAPAVAHEPDAPGHRRVEGTVTVATSMTPVESALAARCAVERDPRLQGLHGWVIPLHANEAGGGSVSLEYGQVTPLQGQVAGLAVVWFLDRSSGCRTKAIDASVTEFRSGLYASFGAGATYAVVVPDTRPPGVTVTPWLVPFVFLQPWYVHQPFALTICGPDTLLGDCGS